MSTLTRNNVVVPHSDTLNVVSSDHRPFTINQKAMGKDDFTKIPHGVPGIQDRMSVLWERGVVRSPLQTLGENNPNMSLASGFTVGLTLVLSVL